MKKKILIGIGSLLVVAILFAGVRVTSVYAQTGTPPTPTGGQAPDGRGHGGHALGQAELAAAAQALHLTTEEVSAALTGGKTLADLATTAGVNIQDVQAAIQAAHQQELRTQIQAAAADGSITQANADWLLDGLDKGYLDGPGFGFGFGGPHGDRHGNEPPQPAATPIG